MTRPESEPRGRRDLGTAERSREPTRRRRVDRTGPSEGAKPTSALRTDGGVEQESGRVSRDSGRVGQDDGRSLREIFDPEELRRRNASAVAIDLLYLFATAFLTTLLVRGFWPAVFAAVPLALLVYFAWRSTTAFLVAQAIVIVLTVIATYAGVLPL